MTTTKSSLNEIDILPGVMPGTDATPSDIPCWASASRVRFDPTTGRLRKLGGWMSNVFDYDDTVTGTIRTIYSATINQKVYTVLGTNSYLYGQIGSSLTNISPLEIVSIPAANSLATHYATLDPNPIATANNSTTVLVFDAEGEFFQAGDSYTLSGATTSHGIPDTELNATHVVRSASSGLVVIHTTTAATSAGFGGGASVVRSSGLITLTKAAHGLNDGDRVKISGAANTGGILAAAINLEFIIRNVLTNSFDFMTAGTATSSVSAAGGAGTVYYPQIAAGNLNQGTGQGYGAGRYGVGLYGTALVSSSGETFPRIWFCDRFGDNIVMTPGNSSGCYTWDGSTNIAPSLIPNAPTDINYLFVSNNILVTFGHDVENKIFASDQGDYTQWTASSTNDVFEQTVQGIGRLISHCPVDGYNLIFTELQTYTMKFIGGASIWQILPLDPNIGLIAPMARVSVNGIAYWMGQDNFYWFRGGKIEVMPCNFATESSMLRYVFNNLNNGQRLKCFAGYNREFDEVWFHYPSAASNECDQIARFSRKLNCWVPDDLARTAWEYPLQNLSNPRLANVSTLYTHEIGNNDDGLPMVFTATSKKYIAGKQTAIQTQMVPDSNMSGTVALQVRTYLYPQSANTMSNKSYAVISTTEKIPVQQNGRVWDYTISGEALDQSFLMGQWYEEPQSAGIAP